MAKRDFALDTGNDVNGLPSPSWPILFDGIHARFRLMASVLTISLQWYGVVYKAQIAFGYQGPALPPN